MIKLILFLSLLFGVFATQAQILHKDCHCPKNPMSGTKVDTVFQLSNGKNIALCGFRDKDEHPPIFSEFVLSPCGQDTIIGGGGALMPCQISIRKDTLLVQRMKYLATGSHFTLEQNIWETDQIYFNGDKAQHQIVLNPNLRKYNQEEIKKVLDNYQKYGLKVKHDRVPIIDELFMATLSGSTQAHNYFKAIGKDPDNGLDGVLGEQYSMLNRMLKEWLSSNKRQKK